MAHLGPPNIRKLGYHSLEYLLTGPRLRYGGPMHHVDT